jgi:transcriptional regulator with XRE-family HTH domain
VELWIDAVEREEIQKAFGVRLKKLRKQKGWTQKELASKVGVRTAQLNKYESGLHSPPFETLIQIAGVLDTSVDYLLTGDQAEEVPLRSPRLLERFRELEGFDSEDQEMVIRLIDAVIVKRKVQDLQAVSR